MEYSVAFHSARNGNNFVPLNELYRTDRSRFGAQMMAYDSSLKGRERPVKAILLAYCEYKVGNAQGGSTGIMKQGLTAGQGAGMVNVMRICAILINEIRRECGRTKALRRSLSFEFVYIIPVP